MLSMISFAIQSNAIGNSEAKRRKTSPMVTTSGPDRHTILRTGGTCRRADRRSCHPLQKFSCSGIRVIRFEAHASSWRAKTPGEPTAFSRGTGPTLKITLTRDTPDAFLPSRWVPLLGRARLSAGNSSVAVVTDGHVGYFL